MTATVPRHRSPAGIEAVDALGWRKRALLEGYGLRLGLRSNIAAGLRTLIAALPGAWREGRGDRMDRTYSLRVGRGSRPRLTLFRDASVRCHTRSLRGAARALEQDAARWLAESARDRLFLHAGAVGVGATSILVPGRSRSGKSTLVAALVEAGARYYSDEYAVLDARGCVHPFPVILSLRGLGPGRRRRAAAAAKRRRGGPALPVGLVLLTRYRRGARWRPRVVGGGEAVLQLLAHTVSARRQAREALRILPRVTARARVVETPRGEAREIARSLLQLLGADDGALEGGRIPSTRATRRSASAGRGKRRGKRRRSRAAIPPRLRRPSTRPRT